MHTTLAADDMSRPKLRLSPGRTHRTRLWGGSEDVGKRTWTEDVPAAAPCAAGERMLADRSSYPPLFLFVGWMSIPSSRWIRQSPLIRT